MITSSPSNSAITDGFFKSPRIINRPVASPETKSPTKKLFTNWISAFLDQLTHQQYYSEN